LKKNPGKKVAPQRKLRSNKAYLELLMRKPRRSKVLRSREASVKLHAPCRVGEFTYQLYSAHHAAVEPELYVASTTAPSPPSFSTPIHITSLKGYPSDMRT
jgi:hypothetical protein